MKSLIFKLTVIPTFLTFFVYLIVGYSQVSPEKDLKNLAAANLIQMLDKIPAGLEKEYGFKDRQEFSKASIGTPFQICTIIPDSLNGGISYDKSYFTALDEWRIPVVIGGKPRALLTAAKQNGNWEIVDFGASYLASEIGDFDAVHTTDAKLNQRKLLLRLYQLHCDFILLRDNATGNIQGEIYPLQSGKSILQNRYPSKGYFTYKEFIPLIKDIFSQSNFNEK